MNPNFFNSMPVPPSVARVEAQRQQEVTIARERLMATNGTLTAADSGSWYADVWKPLAVIALVLAVFAIGHRVAELDAAPTMEEMAYRLATLEAENVKLNNQIAAIEANVEKKIEAWAMLEANAIAQQQDAAKGPDA